MRRKTTCSFLMGFAALLLAIPVVSIARTRISQWTLLEKISWVSVETEKAIYQTPGSNHFFVHFRITNRTSHPLAIDLQKTQGMWGLFHSFQWSIGNGDGRAPICSRLIPISLGLNLHEKKLLMADYKEGKLTMIPPHESVDYYRASKTGSRADVADKWSAVPLWQKIKTYYSPFPSTAGHLQIIVRGMIRLADGTHIKNPSISETYTGFPFPLHGKQLPANGRIVK